jgi:hypothetical protein
MAARVAAELEEILDRIEKESLPLDSLLSQVCQQMANRFGVEEDEVAIMEIAPSGRFLRFVIPQKLREVGTIPLSSTTALAARTVRERRADVLNNFPIAKHVTVFEGVPLGRGSGESIQKIMSAVIVSGNVVVGVVQICRKGASLTDSGPDFTSRDLSELQSLNQALSRLLAMRPAAQ